MLDASVQDIGVIVRIDLTARRIISRSVLAEELDSFLGVVASNIDGFGSFTGAGGELRVLILNFLV